MAKPKLEDTHCPRCGDSDGTEDDEAVQMVLTTGLDDSRTRVIWCAKGHITAIDNKGNVTVEGMID